MPPLPRPQNSGWQPMPYTLSFPLDSGPFSIQRTGDSPGFRQQTWHEQAGQCHGWPVPRIHTRPAVWDHSPISSAMACSFSSVLLISTTLSPCLASCRQEWEKQKDAQQKGGLSGVGGPSVPGCTMSLLLPLGFCVMEVPVLWVTQPLCVRLKPTL